MVISFFHGFSYITLEELVFENFEKVSDKLDYQTLIKVKPIPSKNFLCICMIENPLKVIKNAFYFIVKALFVLKIFKFFSQLFGHVGKTA